MKGVNSTGRSNILSYYIYIIKRAVCARAIYSMYAAREDMDRVRASRFPVVYLDS